MSPNYFVFCEGDTEVVYVEMLRAHYRLPIHIIAKKTLLNLTNEIKQHLTENQQTAIERARKLVAYGNPSSTVYRLIDDLEKLKHEQEKVAHCSAL